MNCKKGMATFLALAVAANATGAPVRAEDKSFLERIEALENAGWTMAPWRNVLNNLGDLPEDIDKLDEFLLQDEYFDGNLTLAEKIFNKPKSSFAKYEGYNATLLAQEFAGYEADVCMSDETVHAYQQQVAELLEGSWLELVNGTDLKLHMKDGRVFNCADLLPDDLCKDLIRTFTEEGREAAERERREGLVALGGTIVALFVWKLTSDKGTTPTVSDGPADGPDDGPDPGGGDNPYKDLIFEEKKVELKKLLLTVQTRKNALSQQDKNAAATAVQNALNGIITYGTVTDFMARQGAVTEENIDGLLRRARELVERLDELSSDEQKNEKQDDSGSGNENKPFDEKYSELVKLLGRAQPKVRGLTNQQQKKAFEMVKEILPLLQWKEETQAFCFVKKNVTEENIDEVLERAKQLIAQIEALSSGEQETKPQDEEEVSESEEKQENVDFVVRDENDFDAVFSMYSEKASGNKLSARAKAKKRLVLVNQAYNDAASNSQDVETIQTNLKAVNAQINAQQQSEQGNKSFAAGDSSLLTYFRSVAEELERMLSIAQDEQEKKAAEEAERKRKEEEERLRKEAEEKARKEEEERKAREKAEEEERKKKELTDELAALQVAIDEARECGVADVTIKEATTLLSIATVLINNGNVQSIQQQLLTVRNKTNALKGFIAEKKKPTAEKKDNAAASPTGAAAKPTATQTTLNQAQGVPKTLNLKPTNLPKQQFKPINGPLPIQSANVGQPSIQTTQQFSFSFTPTQSSPGTEGIDNSLSSKPPFSFSFTPTQSSPGTKGIDNSLSSKPPFIFSFALPNQTQKKEEIKEIKEEIEEVEEQKEEIKETNEPAEEKKEEIEEKPVEKKDVIKSVPSPDPRDMYAFEQIRKQRDWKIIVRPEDNLIQQALERNQQQTVQKKDERHLQAEVEQIEQVAQMVNLGQPAVEIPLDVNDRVQAAQAALQAAQAAFNDDAGDENERIIAITQQLDKVRQLIEQHKNELQLPGSSDDEVMDRLEKISAKIERFLNALREAAAEEEEEEDFTDDDDSDHEDDDKGKGGQGNGMTEDKEQKDDKKDDEKKDDEKKDEKDENQNNNNNENHSRVDLAYLANVAKHIPECLFTKENLGAAVGVGVAAATSGIPAAIPAAGAAAIGYNTLKCADEKATMELYHKQSLKNLQESLDRRSIWDRLSPEAPEKSDAEFMQDLNKKIAEEKRLAANRGDMATLYGYDQNDLNNQVGTHVAMAAPARM